VYQLGGRKEEIVSNRQRLRRERLEYYLLYLLLAYRYLILITGLLMLMAAIAVMLMGSPAAFTILLPAIFLLLLSNSYHVALYTARLGAWIATLGRDDDGRGVT
jgi:hypothetical protein